MAKVRITGGGFQDVAGNALALGYLTISLSQDAQAVEGGNIAAGREVQIPLDSSGNIASPPISVWPNDQLTPDNTVYLVCAYTAEGELVWGPNSVQILSSPTPFNVGQNWTPPDYGSGVIPNFGGSGPSTKVPRHATLTPVGDLPTDTFTLPDTPYGGVLMALFYNAGFLDSAHYTLTDNQVTTDFTLQEGDSLYAIYF